MKKILSIILIIFSFILIRFTVYSINIVKNHNRKILENKLIEYCENIFVSLDNNDTDIYQITINDMENVFELDISEFKKKNCSLTESYVNARFENKELLCESKLVCEF